jgi:hypothetical protein
MSATLEGLMPMAARAWRGANEMVSSTDTLHAAMQLYRTQGDRERDYPAAMATGWLARSEGGVVR